MLENAPRTSWEIATARTTSRCSGYIRLTELVQQSSPSLSQAQEMRELDKGRRVQQRMNLNHYKTPLVYPSVAVAQSYTQE